MTESKMSRLLVGAANLLVATSPLLATQAQAAVANEDQNIGLLNAASLKSMESSWLKVSVICKARGFNADAAVQTNAAASPRALEIFASYEA